MLVGFSWERCFDAAVGGLSGNDSHGSAGERKREEELVVRRRSTMICQSPFRCFFFLHTFDRGDFESKTDMIHLTIFLLFPPLAL